MKMDLKNNVAGLIAAFIMFNIAGSASAIPIPIVPGNLYVLDHGDWELNYENSRILTVTADGSTSVAVAAEEIFALTGETPNFKDNGLAFDTSGNLYFTEGGSNTVMKLDYDGNLSVVAAAADIKGVLNYRNVSTLEGIAIGSDGMLYVADSENDSIIKIDPTTGEITEFKSQSELINETGLMDIDVDTGIIASEDGRIFLITDYDHFLSDPDVYSGGDGPNAIYSIDVYTEEVTVIAQDQYSDLSTYFDFSIDGNPDDGDYGELHDFMTIDPLTGNLIIPDEQGDVIWEIVTTRGGDLDITQYLLETEIEGMIGDVLGVNYYYDVNMVGGVTFDQEGNFYLVDENWDLIFKYDPYFDTGSVLMTEYSFQDSLGNMDFESGIVFAPTFTTTPVPEPSTWLLLASGLILMLCRKRSLWSS